MNADAGLAVPNWVEWFAHGTQSPARTTCSKIALMWYKRSAEQGYAYAQSALGRMYEKGQAVSKDYIRAYMWFSIAASLWDTDARLMLNRVAKKMSRTQTEIAQRLARECETKVYKGC